MTATLRPVIGINAGLSSEAGGPAMVSLPADYVDAVIQAGGIPIILPNLPVPAPDLIDRQIRMCDGVILVGGQDIDPSLYGQTLHPLTKPMMRRREEYDLALVKALVQAGMPFLGICLGCQEVNVALGGTLVQDIGAETTTSIRHSVKQQSEPIRHLVTIEPGTQLADVVGTTTLSTNSSHHQSILEPAQCLLVSARTDDGIIECLEMRDYPFGLAVQWHPERLTSEPLQLRLFEGLVKAAQATRETRSR
jgi:putative glutamine amidotransferase